MDLVLFGKQGSGKGTLGEQVAKRYNLVVFETGAMLRQLSQEDSELGKKVKEIIESGKLVPNEVVMDIIEDFMSKLEEGKVVLFDGIPRKQDQAASFDNLMKRLGRDYLGLLINVSDEEALRRLTTRRICKNCKKVYPAFYEEDKCEACGGELITRTDDNPESIKTRLATFETETLPVIENLKKQDKIIDINGEQIIEKVFEEAATILDPKFPS